LRGYIRKSIQSLSKTKVIERLSKESFLIDENREQGEDIVRASQVAPSVLSVLRQYQHIKVKKSMEVNTT
jgi:hypothetical protein